MDLEPRFSDLETNGIRLRVAEAGPADGPLVLLLHGFPEFWYGWRHQIGPLAEAGYRVVVPDQRGYDLSDKPKRVGDYALDALTSDIVGLIAALGREKALLVGHDWGGIVAWWAAIREPGRVEKLAILNAPHPLAFRRSLPRNPAQLLRSWYVFYFQIPGLPEVGFRLGNYRGLARALRTTSRPGTFGDEDLDRYRQAWSQPGALTAMIHWYRAALRNPPRGRDAEVRVPTLMIWGARDRFLGPELAREGLARCRDGRLEMIEQATHWVQHEEPALVNRLLLEFAGAP